MSAERQIGCAIIGYGGTHNFGSMHAKWIEENPYLRLIAICDKDESRLQAALEHFPDIQAYTDILQVFTNPEIELVTLVTPNFTHCALAVQAFAYGKHVLTENAMCLNTAEATQMIDAARNAGKMLAVHHNRRHDGNYRLIKEIVDSGEIGEVFRLEFSKIDYAHPFPNHNGYWWADKEKSGGAFYYYGPQAMDWILDLIPSEMETVTGYYNKRVWHDMTDEDEVKATIRFANGAVADFMQSYIDASRRPVWHIVGTKGAIIDSGIGVSKGYQKEICYPSNGSLTLFKATANGKKEETVPYKDSDWHMFYRDIAAHLLHGQPVPISGEIGRRVIGVLETARKSYESGRPEPLPYR